jgi:3-oxoacyl-[acyl-carrier-protein] synthase-3
MIVFATLSPDYSFPGSGVLLQRELGLAGIPALDIRQQCAGFVYALSVADQFIKTGMYKTILVVGSEIQSNIFELSDRGRNVAVIFGDGAGAVVLQASTEPTKGILSTHLHADGTFAEELMMEHPGSKNKKRLTSEMIENGSLLPVMNGQMVFKNAVQRFPEVIN